jgi:hypothetical protein
LNGAATGSPDSHAPTTGAQIVGMTPALSLTLREFARTMVTDFSREEILDGLSHQPA